YDLLALPVVDHAHRLLGLITIDDVVDVIQDIANKNMMLMAGMDEEHDPRNPKIFRAFRQRFTWLSITLVGGIGMAEVIGLFEDTLKAQAYLAGFIPVILGTGGNVGTQAATIAVRNLATGHMGGSGTLSIIFKEARVGTLLGISFGIILGLYVLLSMWATPMFAVAISCSIIITVISAAILGMLVPFTLDKIGIDPAVATGPFVTTGIDLIAILIYFSTCQMILQ
ncbi:MAG: magnesium transporter, partial [Myxococcota bacterium]|nr:magnesium transporter [Myxococcota bacterium]